MKPKNKSFIQELKITQKIRYYFLKFFYKRNITITKSYPRSFDAFLKGKFGDKGIKGVEVGVRDGDHAEFMINYLNIEKFYLIDRYEGYEDYTDKELKKAYEIALKKLGDFEGVEFIVEDSINASKKIKEELDFIYIDADHSYEAVKNEINNYYPLLKEDGIIGGHDFKNYAPNYPESELNGVVQAVLEFVSEKDLKLYVGSSSEWWIVKGEKE